MICWMNGLPLTWVTKPILMRSAFGSADGESDGAAEDGATDGAADEGATDGAVVAPPPVVQAATKSAVMAGIAHRRVRITNDSLLEWS